MNEKQLFDSLNPRDEQRDRVWSRLSQAPQPKQKPRRVTRVLLIAAAMTVVLALSAVGFNAASGGKLLGSFVRLFQSDTVVAQAAHQYDYDTEVYAPALVSVDDKLAVIQLSRGAVVFDRSSGQVKYSIDLQPVNCIYYNSDPHNTCVLYRDNSVIAFNTDNGKPEGSAYVFALSGKEKELTRYTEADAASYFAAWQKQQSRYCDSFDRFLWVQQRQNEMMYSERALCWTDGSGKAHTSLITVGSDNTYILRTFTGEDSEPQSETLTLMTEKEKAAFDKLYSQAVLPPFRYSGDDPVIGAICAYMQEENKDYAADETDPEHCVWIPTFEIVKRAESGGELLCFGFYSDGVYRLNGSQLDNISGGVVPGCMHLQRQGDGYRVVRADMAQDGDRYGDSNREFCGWHLDAYFRLINGEHEPNYDFLRMYITDNRLSVRYVKDFGWDPVDLFPQDSQ